RHQHVCYPVAAPHDRPTKLKKKTLEVEPTPELHAQPPEDRMLTLFCLRDTKGDEVTLDWYADLVGRRRRIVCATFAFNLDEVFSAALLKNDGTLRYAVFDKNPGEEFEGEIRQVKNTVIAPGAKLEKGDMVNFLAEKLTGFNKNLYIHDKFILTDPLGEDPIVVTGTANFSKPSQNAN